MICPECKHVNIDGANFCMNCGNKLISEKNTVSSYAEADKVNHEKLRFSEMFSGIFKYHDTNETEKLFTTGKYSEAAVANDISPHPWLFSRILITVLLLYFGFYVGLIFFQNMNFLPGLIMLGAFLTPISIMIFFWEIDAPSNIPLYRVAMFFLVGGLVSLLYSVILYDIIDGLASPLLAGVVEETAKLMALLIFAGSRRYNYILNGLLIGAAVGTGFAAFESSGYIFMAAVQYGVRPMLHTIFWRAILAPGGHIAWAGLMGAAVMMVKSREHFRVINLFNIKFIAIFAFVILLHTLWDIDFPQPFLAGIPIYPIILTIISWIAILWMIKKGVRQVREDRINTAGTI